jgi:peptide/nickel transport system ATP-binding protein
VRESHKRIDPQLEPVRGRSEHDVACLLAPETRAELWERLRAGELPERARAAVPMGDSTE